MQYFTPAYMKGWTYVRMIFSKPKFLGCIDNQNVLPMVLRATLRVDFQCRVIFTCVKFTFRKSWTSLNFSFKLSTFYLASVLLMWLKFTCAYVRSQKRFSGNQPEGGDSMTNFTPSWSFSSVSRAEISALVLKEIPLKGKWRLHGEGLGPAWNS